MQHSCPRLGAHMSIAGGVDTALDRGSSVGCEVIQIFTKSSNQWKARPLAADEVRRFFAKQASFAIHPIVAHNAYLINIASPDTDLWRRSVEALDEEMERCEMLQIPGLVMHPGSHTGSGEEHGLRRIIAGLDEVASRHSGGHTQFLLETTAGQGTSLGYCFEQLRYILDRVKEPDRIGFCFDTAHVWGAGYELNTRHGYVSTMARFEELLGTHRLQVFHLNDSRREQGSRVDRHAHIGEGLMGLEPFRLLLNDPRFAGRPMILETPKGPDMAEDVENLRLLRSLIGKTDPIDVPSGREQGG